MCRLVYAVGLAACVSGLVLGCGDSGTEADRIGVGAQCNEAAECESADETITLECLRQFTGGYCVTHDDGTGEANYCFRLCRDKPECNRNRDEQNWSNCSANITFVDEPQDRKACVPPSSGIQP
jgi:hypothetical protein